MTREEARLTLQENLGMLSFMFSRRISEAIKVALEVLSQPSFPSNLDEAAEVFSKRQGVELAPFAKKFFKAGAKWMAEQGYTVDGIVICDKELTRGYKDIVMSIPDELKVDDKVTIQIRKRQ